MNQEAIKLINAQLFSIIATAFYVIGLGVTFKTGFRPNRVRLILLPALVANAAAVVMRYLTAWPMLPMYMGPQSTTLFLCCVIVLNGSRPESSAETASALRIILGFTSIIAATTICFPKDFYLPFIQSQTLWAHSFFFFGVVGKGCFLVSASWALGRLQHDALEKKGKQTKRPFDGVIPHLSSQVPASCHVSLPLSRRLRSMRWMVWGFFFWTLSMFAGELWSYRGWGTPVVWSDPAITTTMATWFFYIGLLHLHLTGSWTVRGRQICTAMGAVVVLSLNLLPDLGPFRWPF